MIFVNYIVEENSPIQVVLLDTSTNANYISKKKYEVVYKKDDSNPRSFISHWKRLICVLPLMMVKSIKTYLINS